MSLAVPLNALSGHVRGTGVRRWFLVPLTLCGLLCAQMGVWADPPPPVLHECFSPAAGPPVWRVGQKFTVRSGRCTYAPQRLHCCSSYLLSQSPLLTPNVRCHASFCQAPDTKYRNIVSTQTPKYLRAHGGNMQCTAPMPLLPLRTLKVGLCNWVEVMGSEPQPQVVETLKWATSDKRGSKAFPTSQCNFPMLWYPC